MPWFLLDRLRTPLPHAASGTTGARRTQGGRFGPGTVTPTYQTKKGWCLATFRRMARSPVSETPQRRRETAREFAQPLRPCAHSYAPQMAPKKDDGIMGRRDNTTFERGETVVTRGGETAWESPQQGQFLAPGGGHDRNRLCDCAAASALLSLAAPARQPASDDCTTVVVSL